MDNSKDGRPDTEYCKLKKLKLLISAINNFTSPEVGTNQIKRKHSTAVEPTEKPVKTKNEKKDMEQILEENTEVFYIDHNLEDNPCHHLFDECVYNCNQKSKWCNSWRLSTPMLAV
ncbi:uncharacterized protein LOC142984325 isoform X2 [Anticarsia gemmatalis]